MENKEKQNNMKLRTCLENAPNAIILIEINDASTEIRLRTTLEEDYGMEMICYRDVQNNFISLLHQMSEDDQLQKVCFYAFEQTPENYDIVKSLNISREILSRIGILIFMMPTFLVKQIEYEEPNLQDYILLKLDYTVHQKIPFEPIFSIQYFPQYEKKEQQSLKQYASNLTASTDEALNQYFRYLQRFQYRRISQQEYTNNFRKEFAKINSYLSNYSWENIHEHIIALADVWYKTAQTLAAQYYLDDALDLFTKMTELLKLSAKPSIYYLHALEGCAFCFYHLCQYENAEKALLMMIDFLDESGTENEAWKYKVYNDYAACFYKSGDFKKAYKIWKMCENALQELHIANIKRIYRNKYNLLLVRLESEDNLYTNYSQWHTLKEQLLKAYSQKSTIYSEYQLLLSWIDGIIFGRNEYAIQQAYEALQTNRTLLQENSYDIALSHYVISNLYRQRGDIEHSDYCMKKCTNILKNCRLTNQYLKSVIND